MRTSNCDLQIRFCTSNCDLQIRFCTSNCDLQIQFCTSNCDLQIRFCALNCDLQIVIYKSRSPVSCTQFLICDLVGLVTKFPARERDQNYKMADEKYSEVVELLRRAESLLSPNPSTNNQQVTNATAGPSTSRPSTNLSGASEGGMAMRANL